MTRKMLKEEKAVLDKLRYYRHPLPNKGSWDEKVCLRKDRKIITAFRKAVEERCAKVAESHYGKRATCDDPECAGPRRIAAAIRGRGKK